MPILENPTGPYAVGAVTFTLPVRPTRVIGGATVRTETGKIVPALRLEEVSFTAYYPVSPTTTESRWNWLDWFPRYMPLAETVRGYSHFSGISTLLLWPLVLFFGSRLKVPAFVNTPPLQRIKDKRMDPTAPPNRDSSQGPWPLVIFSHGLGGGRTTYSQLCTHLASSGKVVLALEHRDGTSPITWPLSGETGKRYPHFYVKPDDVIRDNVEETSGFHDPRFAFRADQLELRKREVYHSYSAFRELVQTGERGDLQTMDESPFDWASWAGDWVRCDEGVSLVGHSFGGATVFAMLSLKEEDILRIPVSHGLVLDPWLDPILPPGPAPDTNQNSSPKLMVINAEGFTLWTEHFKRVEEVVCAWPESALLTIIRGQHNSFSDLPVMPPVPIRKSTARPIMNVIKTLTLSFLDDQLPGSVNRLNVRKLEIEYPKSRPWSKNPKRRLVGNAGDIIIHRFGVVE
ncbi:platelet-activating factor acetylhydrolase, isoform II-domain-containing protein [Lactarius pseudohatsudake]|nr:platelet-activating factor acetylhydrolase, isoform II-domain-containing protein [Lactarius pseudohatsudake]